MGQCRVDIYYTLVLFYPRCTAWWLFKPFISSSMAKTSRKRFFRLGFRSHMVWRPGLAQSFLYFRCILIGQRWLYPTCVSSDPDIKSEELLWVGAGSTFIIHRYYFIICTLLLVHLRLKHRGNVFSVRIWQKGLLSKGDVGIRLG